MEAILASEESSEKDESERHIILVIEDDPDISFSLAAVLKAYGYEVVTAANGEQALELLMSCKDLPCAILLDLMMPIMDGWSFRIRQLQDRVLAAIPVCVISGASDLKDAVSQLGVTDFLQKPFGHRDVMEKVEKFCPL